jgi:RNA polymerase sigma factor (sigma-70 family)
VIVSGTGFEECFRTHFARLVALGESMAGDREIARDLAQESFLRLHRQWDSISRYDNVGGWLSRVMANLLIDHHRSTVSEQRAIERLAHTRRPVDRSPTTHRTDDAWRDLVSVLPLRQRVIVTLHYGEDLSVADIAAALDVSPNTVKSALSKARDALRSRGGTNDA